MMETMKLTYPRGGWQEDEINVLFQAVKTAADSGQPLRDVFADVAEELKRKPNSIRNFYYAKLRELPEINARKVPFRTFTQEELHGLLRTVLIARGNGESVRACVTRMAGGDRGLMLRYQNKYRSILKNRPDMLEAVAAELRAEGLPCPMQVASYRRAGNGAQQVNETMEEALRLCAELDDDFLPLLLTQVCALYRRVQDAEMRMPQLTSAPSTPVEDTAQSSTPDLAITLTDLRHAEASELANAADETDAEYYGRWLDARRDADRLRVQVDLLKLHLEDTETEHQFKLNLLRDTLRGFLSLPAENREGALDGFVNKAGEALHALELEEELG